MKAKFILISALFMMGMASCGNSSNSKQDSIAADSVSVVAVDSIESEPEAVVAEKENPEEVLSASIAKKNLQYGDESSAKTGTVTVNVVNKGTTEIKGSEYELVYQEVVEEWVGSNEDGGLEDVTKNRTVAGKDVAPGETVTITLKSGEGCQDIKNPKIKAVK